VVLAPIALRATVGLLAQPKYRDAQSLKGKQIVVSAIPGTDGYLTLRFLEKHGVRKDDVTLRPVPNLRARYAMLTEKQTDAVTITISQISRSVAQGYRLIASPTQLGEFPWNLLQAQRGWANNNRDVVVRIIRAMRSGILWLYDPAHSSQAVKIIAKASKLPAVVIRSGMGQVLKHRLLELEPLPQRGLDRAVEFVKYYKLLKREVDASKAIDMGPYREAMNMK